MMTFGIWNKEINGKEYKRIYVNGCFGGAINNYVCKCWIEADSCTFGADEIFDEKCGLKFNMEAKIYNFDRQDRDGDRIYAEIEKILGKNFTRKSIDELQAMVQNLNK